MLVDPRQEDLRAKCMEYWQIPDLPRPSANPRQNPQDKLMELCPVSCLSWKFETHCILNLVFFPSFPFFLLSFLHFLHFNITYILLINMYIICWDFWIHWLIFWVYYYCIYVIQEDANFLLDDSSKQKLPTKDLEIKCVTQQNFLAHFCLMVTTKNPCIIISLGVSRLLYM